MAETLQFIPPESIVVGWDFSTGSVKAVPFPLSGKLEGEVRLPTDLWTENGVSELNVMQLEGQARASVRGLVSLLRKQNALHRWTIGGVSATHHSAAKIDANHNQVRRAICWNDQSLAAYHAKGVERLGGMAHIQDLIGGPWAVRYTLSHLVKDEETLNLKEWLETHRMLPHGPLAAGYLTGKFDVISVSSAASTGIMDFRTNQWCQAMLDCLRNANYREMTWNQLPRIIDMNEPIGQLAEHVAIENGISMDHRPWIYPTLDDQAAGLLGGGAVEPGQVAVILGNSAVVNSSANVPPRSGSLDAMKLNWGPYLWMRCYSNGAQFLDRVVGAKPNWDVLEQAARAVPAGCNGTMVLPFQLSEPSIGVHAPRVQWFPSEPSDPGVRFRASLEALAYLIVLGIEEHRREGQQINRITISGGIAKNQLMGEILASAASHRLERLQSSEGPAQGAAIAALAGAENYLRKQNNLAPLYTVEDAVRSLVQFRDPVDPISEWLPVYKQGLETFRGHLKG